MKNFIVLICLAFIGFSCTDNNKNCQYTKLVTVTYNYNVTPSKEVSRDTLTGCFFVEKNNNSASIVNNESDYKLTLIEGVPNSLLEVKDSKTNNWDESNGYKISNKTSGDTLFISYLPVNVTDRAVLKFGTIYKFYK